MAATLRHRGPDDGGVWTDSAAGVALANRRLAVRDLSPAGHQPMVSADGRLVLTYNGEIYDAEPLRDELSGLGHHFRGRSDTEVLLAALRQWGPEGALARLDGMYAFALWDATKRQLVLARDPFGIKPLYWAKADGLFLFASELKAMRVHPHWRPAVDRDALAAYARLSYVPSPACIWQGARKLEPGTLLVLEADGEPRIRRHFDLAAVAGAPRRVIGLDEATGELESLMAAAVRRRLVADVPVGVFLSGGLDSSLVAAMARREGGAPIETFTVGFERADYDESAAARRIARHLGTIHHELMLGPAEALALVPDIVRCFDEPFADSSQLPGLAVARFARRHITVALTGDGGDEVFAGYNRHLWLEHHWPTLRRLPVGARRLAARALAALPPAAWDRLAAPFGVSQAGEKAHKLAAVVALKDDDAAYRVLVGQGVDGAALVAAKRQPPMATAPAMADPVERMLFMDTVGYLPDDILTKVDRVTMAVGLEARVPYLDRQIVAFAWGLPRALRVAGGIGKRVLRTVARRHLPTDLVDGRPKAGFAVPLAAWLRGPLRGWAEALLDSGRLASRGFFDAALVGRWWRDHLAGRGVRHHALWNVLVFEAWFEDQNRPETAPGNILPSRPQAGAGAGLSRRNSVPSRDS